MKPVALLLSLAVVLPATAFAAGGGGGGGSGGAGGASGGAAHSGGSSAGAGTSAPAAGTAGVGSTSINGVTGPANAAGLNNSTNNPSGTNIPPTSNNTGTVGLANPSVSPTPVPQGPGPRGVEDGLKTPTQGTNSAGTAVGSDGALRGNGTVMPGPNRPTATRDQERDSDAKIDEENRKTDRAVSNICKGC